MPFALISLECVSKVIDNLDTLKATQQEDISEIRGYIIKTFNNSVNEGVFPDELKHAAIKPIYKKNPKIKKKMIDL